MSVADLETIAKESHNGEIKAEPRSHHHGLESKERLMGISLVQRRDQLRGQYPEDPIIAAELGCFYSTVVGDMNLVEGIEAFGIDLDPKLDSNQRLSSDRLIVADLNHMPHVPDNSFHYAFSFNVLSYTDITRSFPEIYRVLKPGGIADLDLEFWQKNHAQELLGVELHRQGHLVVATRDGKFSGCIPAYFTHIQELAKTDQMAAASQEAGTRFVLTKPYESS